MTGLEITLIIAVCYIGIGFVVVLACNDEDHSVGKGCVWPLYLIVEATKAVSDLIQEFKEVYNELKNSK